MTGAASETDRIGVRDFLDSRMGRAFADEVACALRNPTATSETAIEAAIRLWQGWRISRAMERSDGIPAGLPYLTGWVQHFAVLAESEGAD